MTNQKLLTTAAVALSGALLVPALAFAQTDAGASVNAAAAVTANTTSVQTATGAGAQVTHPNTAMGKAQTKADQEIDRRVAALNDLMTRVQAMQKVTDAFKQSIENALQGQVSGLTSLKAKIDADTDTTTLKQDVGTVTQSYSVYALILPQARIAAAADRVIVLTSMMTTLGSKLQARISAAQNAGANTSALMAALTDMSTKLSDASSQAQAAVSVSAPLAPSNGDKTKAAANAKALKTASGDIKTSVKDLQAVRKDIDTILKGLAAIEANPGASATTTTTTSTAPAAQQ